MSPDDIDPMAETEQDEYLWDGTGTPGPGVARLEEMLAPLRHRGVPPELPVRRPMAGARGRRWALAAVGAAAVLLLVASGVFLIFLTDLRGAGWAVQSVTGMPVIDGSAIADSARLGIGEWLVTDGSSRARIAVGRIGRVDVDPNSRVQLVVSAGREHRMALERGTIHARIWAPPKFFYVNTPAAVAIDLGCAYSLHVDGSGAGLLRVTHGWVGFESGGRQSFIPEGAMCATRPGVGPGTPRYEDAPSGYAEALATLDFGAPDDPARTAAFELVVSQARRRDALTLWHLLARGTSGERERVFDRLSALAPPPRTVTRRLVLAGDRRALDQWWDALGVESSTWWRLWKKKW